MRFLTAGLTRGLHHSWPSPKVALRRGYLFSAPCWTRTNNPLIKSPALRNPNADSGSDLGRTADSVSPMFPQSGEKTAAADDAESAAAEHGTDARIDDSLARLIEEWPTLPPAIKAAVIALVD